MDFLLQVAHWFASPVHWQGEGGVPNRLFEHVELSALAMLVGIAIALPLGALLGHFGIAEALANNVSNIGRAIPSFAILVIAVQVFGIGAAPAFAALVALAVPPVFTNSFVGVHEVD